MALPEMCASDPAVDLEDFRPVHPTGENVAASLGDRKPGRGERSRIAAGRR
jgi:hypothetical protein